MGERMTLVARVTIPILASTGAKIGTVTSVSTMHLKFVKRSDRGRARRPL